MLSFNKCSKTSNIKAIYRIIYSFLAIRFEKERKSGVKLAESRFIKNYCI